MLQPIPGTVRIEIGMVSRAQPARPSRMRAIALIDEGHVLARQPVETTAQ